MSDADGTAEPAAETDRGRLPGLPVPTDELDRYLELAALALALVFAVVAAFGLYDSARRIIEVWVTEAYQPVFAAGLNLVVLLLALGVVGVLVRRLSE